MSGRQPRVQEAQTQKGDRLRGFTERSRNFHTTENRTEKGQPRPASTLTQVTPIKGSGPEYINGEGGEGEGGGFKGRRGDNGGDKIKDYICTLKCT